MEEMIPDPDLEELTIIPYPDSRSLRDPDRDPMIPDPDRDPIMPDPDRDP